jgi:hyaluronan synthase
MMAAGLKWGSLDGYLHLLKARSYTAFLPALGAGYALLILLLQAFRTVLWACYRPHPPAAGPLPRLTVVVPVYNEGAMVGRCLEAVAQADYPRDRLEIIAVDDGSTDDTWRFLEQAAGRHPDLVKTLRFSRNRGKKPALYAGFRAARGEVLVTVDSDSLIDREALRHLVAPLMSEPQVGAVAGFVRVLNRHQSLMGKMQGVRFINLDFLRASQSWYGTVICTPGSLSAYRREALMPVLDAWLHQTFLGAPCHHSEDRALTNFILRQGWHTCYQRTAVVHTLVPETYAGVCRMYLRWERGNVRESAVMATYLFTRFRNGGRALARAEFVLTQLEAPLSAIFFGVFLVSVLLYPAMLFKVLLAIGIMSGLHLVYYLRLERDLEVVYGLLYSYYAFFLLQWIYPYAVLTVRDRRWLTR